VRLARLYPEYAYRTCSDCVTYLYEDNGEIQRTPRMIGLPVLRPAGATLECENCPKIPPGRPKTRFQAVEMGPREWAAYRFYLRCKAVGRFPEDEAVEVAAGAALEAEESARQTVEARRAGRLTRTLMLAITKGAK
jgi:hypothetical protein